MGVGGRGLGGRDVGECLGHFRRVRSSRLDQPGRPGQATSRDVTLPSRVKPPLLATPSKTSVMRYHQYIDSEFWISEGFVVHFTTVESYCDHTSFAPLQGLHYRSRIKVPGLLIAQEREPSIFFNIARYFLAKPATVYQAVQCPIAKSGVYARGDGGRHPLLSIESVADIRMRP
jgi:hypothetical protein